MAAICASAWLIGLPGHAARGNLGKYSCRSLSTRQYGPPVLGNVASAAASNPSGAYP